MVDVNFDLSESEKERYNRQIILHGWGEEGQKKVKSSTVFIAGAGGLGSSASMYLAAAGVGCIRICDSGRVELSNLNRQILHSDKNLGELKVKSAIRTIAGINPEVETVALKQKISPDNIEDLVSDSEIIIDCLDNFQTRYILNEYAVHKGIPLVHGGVYGMSGQITFIHNPFTPCLKCIFPSSPPAGTFPVVGATPGIIGCIQALEALKYITGIKTLIQNRLLIWEGDTGRFTEVLLRKQISCPVCGKK